MTLAVSRSLDEASQSFMEKYTFTNNGNGELSLTVKTADTFAIFTPFNDHYTNTSDVLEHRDHTHIWASGENSSWVKTNRMGGQGPNLGLAVTQGALSGYSVDSRDVVTGSNTRGVFSLHPKLPALKAGESTTLA